MPETATQPSICRVIIIANGQMYVDNSFLHTNLLCTPLQSRIVHSVADDSVRTWQDVESIKSVEKAALAAATSDFIQ